MNPIVRAIDVGFGNTKFVTACANGKVDCSHFASLVFFGHTDGGAYRYSEGAFQAIVVGEDPPPARSRRRDQVAPGAAAHLFRVHLQNAGGLNKAERVHGLSSAGSPSPAHTAKGPQGVDPQ